MEKEFGQYLLAGAAAFSADFSSLWLLKELAGLHYLLAAALAFLVGLSVSYILNIMFVFRQYRHRHGYLETVFVVIAVGGIAINHTLMWLIAGEEGLYYLWAKIIVTVVVTVWNFGVKKLLLFNKSNRLNQ